jgi:short-subunit dehydrogenase
MNSMNDYELKYTRNKMALITGASGGLGKAFAVECASRGWDVFLTDLSTGPLNALAAGLRNSYRVKVITHPCDLADPASRSALYDRIQCEQLVFSTLINVAGIDYEGLFYEQSNRQIQSIIRLNVEGTIAMTHASLQFRNPLETFRIINVASLAAFYPMPVKATYAASKRFLLDFSLALREEIKGIGATVTVLCPAGMPTNPDCIRGIEAQGWMGQLTTMDVGRVANMTLNAALAGKAVVIPGPLNWVMQKTGALIPVSLLTRLISRRWMSARNKNIQEGVLAIP